jgi:hypothetical protein
MSGVFSNLFGEKKTETNDKKRLLEDSTDSVENKKQALDIAKPKDCLLATEEDKELKKQIDVLNLKSQVGGKRKMKGGKAALCHMLCLAIIAIASGMTAAGLYQYYGEAAALLEAALGKGSLCKEGAIQTVTQDIVRSMSGQVSCQAAAQTYFQNLNNFKTTVLATVGPITLATVPTIYKKLYSAVVDQTGCDKVGEIKDGNVTCEVPATQEGGRKKKSRKTIKKGGKKLSKSRKSKK